MKMLDIYIFKCCLTKEVWRNLNLESFRLELATTVLVKDAVELILKAKEEQKLLMIITMCYIWQVRNIIREEGQRRGADFLARCIRLYAEENTAIVTDNSLTGNSVRRRKEYWRKPPQGFLKLNCDGSFLPSSMEGSWGYLIRDCDGDVIVSGRGKIECLLNAFQAELIA